METKELTFTREELEDISFALFIHSNECLMQKCMALYDVEKALRKKIENYLNQQPKN